MTETVKMILKFAFGEGIILGLEMSNSNIPIGSIELMKEKGFADLMEKIETQILK